MDHRVERDRLSGIRIKNGALSGLEELPRLRRSANRPIQELADFRGNKVRARLVAPDRAGFRAADYLRQAPNHQSLYAPCANCSPSMICAVEPRSARCTAGLWSARARAQHACMLRVGGGLLCSVWAVSHVGSRSTRSTLICSPLLVLPICALTELSCVRRFVSQSTFPRTASQPCTFVAACALGRRAAGAIEPRARVSSVVQPRPICPNKSDSHLLVRSHPPPP